MADEPLSAEIVECLMAASTATITTQLFKRGFRTRFMQGVAPVTGSKKLVGVARTLRYIPQREDLDTLENWARPENPQRRLAEEVNPGEVVVIDARGVTASGAMGSILINRMIYRGGAGLVTDGPVRDHPTIAALDWPVYCAGAHANTNLTQHHVEEMDVAVGCGGVHVRPGDVVVGDGEGVVVIPIGLVEEIAPLAAEQERQEIYIEGRVRRGASIEGWYPLSEENRSKYEADLLAGVSRAEGI